MSICDDSYNKFKKSRGMIYNIIERLMLGNEEIWKLLKYPNSSALTESNLSLQEKAQLIYESQPDQSDFRVFRQPFMSDGFSDVVTQLRIYTLVLEPTNKVWGTADFAIEILCHNDIVNLKSYENRLEVMLQQIIETLNGYEIEGLGKLFFNKDARSSNTARMNLYNNKSYLGYTMVMSTRVK